MKYLQRLFRNNPNLVLLLLALNIETALAAPVDGRAVQGAVSITYNPPVIRIVQQTEDAVVQWRSFNLAVGERLEIVQPSQNSRLINRVISGGLSDIRGNIQSNGQIFLINPRGIHHQKAAHARVGGLVLSGLDLDPSGVIGNPVRLLDASPNIIGQIINFGTIETLEGGNTALVGRWVLNKGLITGELSSIALAVGRAANIAFDYNGLINLNVTREEPKVANVDSAPLGNFGAIVAPSGRIFIAGSVSSPAFKPLQNTAGEVASDSEIALAPGSAFNFGLGSKFLNRGVLDASNPYDNFDGRNGGRVVIVAATIESSAPISASTLHESIAGQLMIAASDTVNLVDGSDLNVDPEHYAAPGAITVLGKTILIKDIQIGANEGGTIIIGGRGTKPSSQLVDTLSINAQTDIQIYGDFNLGTVKFWAKDAVDVAGSVVANSYHGGDVQLVSGGRLRFNTDVDLAAGSREPYIHGTLLLHARNLEVAPTENAWIVNSIKLDRALDSARVTLKADEDLALSGSPASLVLTDDVNDELASTLLLEAGRNLSVQQAGIIDLRATIFRAGNDIQIMNLTSGYTHCQMSAGRNIQVSDSVFIYSCNPESPGSIEADGTVSFTNSLFF